jgi:hypothetical protein
MVQYHGHMNREQAEAALQAWATVQRDDLVRAAYEAGVSKNRIHALTGLARTTIDRILEAPVGTTTQSLAAYLAKFTQAWPAQPQPWEGHAWILPTTVASQHTAAEVAQWLLADAEFKALRLGNWLSTPDGKLVMTAIGMLAPAPYAQDVELLAEALQLAAKQQQTEARAKIIGALALGGVALAIGAAGNGK